MPPLPIEEMAPEYSQEFEEPEPERTIHISRELREKTMQVIAGDALKQFLETRADLKELVDKIYDVFRIDDSQIAFRARTI